MRMETGLVSKKSDFLIIFASFANSVGWKILKQKENELYLHSDVGGYFNIKIQNFDYEGANMSDRYGAISGAFEFDESKEFQTQSGFILNSRHPSSTYKPRSDANPLPALMFANKDGINLSSYTICGNSKTLFAQLDLNVGANYSFFTSVLQKTHEFKGGQIVYSDAYFYRDTDYHWERSLRWGANSTNYMPCGAGYYACGCAAFLLSDKWHMMYEYADISKLRVASNLSNFVEKQNEVPFAPILATNITKNIKVSDYSGLNPLITSQFFYKNDLDKWVHAGFLSDIKIITRGNLKNKTELFLGDEKYIFLENSQGYVEYYGKGERYNQNNEYGFALRLD